jgi:hypothetical protein
MASLLTRDADRMRGVLSCDDRVGIIGTLPGLGDAAGMTAYVAARGVRLFDDPKWAEPLRDQRRAHAERGAREHGRTIDILRQRQAFRKEDRVQAILAQRGHHPGWVHLVSAMERCPSYQPWHDKHPGKTLLRPDRGNGLHDDFSFIDSALGLCSLRVPTWAPFRLQVSVNGPQHLAAPLPPSRGRLHARRPRVRRDRRRGPRPTTR